MLEENTYREASLPRQKILNGVSALLPWGLGLSILIYLVRHIPFEEVVLGFSQIKWGWFFLASFGYFLVVLYGDALGLYYFFKRFVSPVSYSEVLHVRGRSFLISIVNYLLGQAALAYYVKKHYRASLSLAFGAVSFVTVMDLMLTLTSGLLALSVTTTKTPLSISGGMLRFLVVLLWASYALWAWFWSRLTKETFEKLDRFYILHRIFSHSVFLIFREAKLKDYVYLFLLRLPVLFVVIGGLNLAFYSFGASLPWADVYLFHPIVLLVSSVPITPAGLGTSQALMMEFFESSLSLPTNLSSAISGAHLIFVVSLIWNLANQIYKALYGAVAVAKSKIKY